MSVGFSAEIDEIYSDFEMQAVAETAQVGNDYEPQTDSYQAAETCPRGDKDPFGHDGFQWAAGNGIAWLIVILLERDQMHERPL